MKINEVLNTATNKIPTTIKEVTTRLEDAGIWSGFTVNDDLTVDVHTSREIEVTKNLTSLLIKNNESGKKGLQLAVKFNNCPDLQFTLRFIENLTSLKGCPRVCRSFSGMNLKNVKTFEGIPEEAEYYDLWYESRIKSYSGIHKAVKKANIFVIGPNTQDSILGFLLIPGLNRLIAGAPGTRIDYSEPDLKPVFKAAEIIQRHLHGDRDVISCKKELIAAGLEKFAKL